MLPYGTCPDGDPIALLHRTAPTVITHLRQWWSTSYLHLPESQRVRHLWRSSPVPAVDTAPAPDGVHGTSSSRHRSTRTRCGVGHTGTCSDRSPCAVVVHIVYGPAGIAASLPVRVVITPTPAAIAAHAPWSSTWYQLLQWLAPVLEYITLSSAVSAASAPVMRHIAPAPAGEVHRTSLCLDRSMSTGVTLKLSRCLA